jgi:hypothetical protein
MEAPARSTDALRRIHGAAGIVVATALLGIWLVTLTGLDTSISMSPISSVVIPGLIGALFLGAYLRRVLQFSAEPNSEPWRKWNIESKSVHVTLAVMAGLVCAGLLAYFSRDAMRVLAAALGGETKTLTATVQSKRTTYGVRNRCREFATFELSDGRAVEVCVRHKYRPDLIQSELDDGERVTLTVQSNQVGDTLIAVARREP